MCRSLFYTKKCGQVTYVLINYISLPYATIYKTFTIYKGEKR